MRVVVIDDEPLVRFAIYRALQESGAAVTSTDSAMAIDTIDDLIAADATPEVIVVARHLAFVDGVIVVDRCCTAAALAGVGFVLLSSDERAWTAEDQAFTQMLAHCAVQPRTVRLAKPFRASEIVACVREVSVAQ